MSISSYSPVAAGVGDYAFAASLSPLASPASNPSTTPSTGTGATAGTGQANFTAAQTLSLQLAGVQQTEASSLLAGLNAFPTYGADGNGDPMTQILNELSSARVQAAGINTFA